MWNLFLSLLMTISSAQTNTCKVDEEKAAKIVEVMNAWKAYCVLPIKPKLNLPKPEDLFASQTLNPEAVEKFNRTLPYELTKIHRHNALLAKRERDCAKFSEQLGETHLKLTKTHAPTCDGFKPLAQDIEKTRLHVTNIANLCFLAREANEKLTTRYQRNVVNAVAAHSAEYPRTRGTASEKHND